MSRYNTRSKTSEAAAAQGYSSGRSSIQKSDTSVGPRIEDGAQIRAPGTVIPVLSGATVENVSDVPTGQDNPAEKQGGDGEGIYEMTDDKVVTDHKITINIFSTSDNQKTTQRGVLSMSITVPEWRHLKVTTKLSYLIDNLKLHQAQLEDTEVTEEKPTLKVQMHGNWKQEMRTDVQKVFEIAKNDMRMIFYHVPGHQLGEVGARLQFCKDRNGSFHILQKHSAIAIVATTGYEEEVFSEARTMIFATNDDENNTQKDMRPDSGIQKSESAESVTYNSGSGLHSEATQKFGETPVDVELEKSLEIKTSINLYLQACDVAREYVVKTFSDKGVTCKFDHGLCQVIFSSEKKELLESVEKDFEELVREETVATKKALQIYSLDDITRTVKEKINGPKLAILPRKHTITLIGTDPEVAKAEGLLREMEEELSEFCIEAPDMSHAMYLEIEHEAQEISKKHGVLKMKHVPPSGVQVIGKKEDVHKLKDLVQDILVEEKLEMSEEELAFLKHSKEAEKFLMEQAEEHELMVRVDTERKLYFVKKTEKSENKSILLPKWYKFKIVMTTRGLEGKSEETVRHILTENEEVDERKVLVYVKDGKWTLIATSDEYSKAEKVLEQIRLEKIDILRESAASRDSQSSSNNQNVEEQTDADSAMCQTNPDSADESEDPRSFTVVFEDKAGGKDRTTKRLNVSAFKVIHMKKKDALTRTLEKRHGSVISDFKVDENNWEVTMTITREEIVTGDQWQQNICENFCKASETLHSEKIKIRDTDFKTVVEKVINNLYDNVKATFIPLQQEKSVVLVCSAREQEKTLKQVNDLWKSFIEHTSGTVLSENMDPHPERVSGENPTGDNMGLQIGGASASTAHGSGQHVAEEDLGQSSSIMTVGIIIEGDWFKRCRDTFPQEPPTFKTYDILAKKKLILMKGQQDKVESFIKRIRNIPSTDEKTEKPVVIDVDNMAPITETLALEDGELRLLTGSVTIQKEIFQDLISKDVIFCLEEKRLLLWGRHNDSEYAVDLIHRSVKRRGLPNDVLKVTPFASLKEQFENINHDVINVEQSGDGIWVYFSSKLEPEVSEMITQLEEDAADDEECVTISLDEYRYYDRFHKEDLKALGNDNGVDIIMSQTQLDESELMVAGTKKRVRTVVDFLENKSKLECKEFPVEDRNMEYFKYDEGKRLLESIEREEKCIITQLDSYEPPSASWRDMYRQSSADGRRSVSVVVGQKTASSDTVIMVPVWESDRFGGLKSPGVATYRKTEEKKMLSLNFTQDKLTCFLENMSLGENSHDQVCVLLPDTWGDGSNNQRKKIIKAFASVVRDVYRRYGLKSVLVDLHQVEARLTEKAVKSIFQSLKELWSAKETLEFDVIFWSESQTYTKKLKEWCKLALTEDRPTKHYGAQLVLGELVKTQAHALVNTTDQKLDLSQGAVSQSIKKKAGDSILEECKKKYPNGIQFDEIAYTQAWKIKTAKAVFHVALRKTTDYSTTTNNIEQVIKRLVMMCLDEASRKGYRSIAFPALGTGKLNYPHQTVARAMFRGVDEFGRLNQDSSLTEVYFVLYPADRKSIQAFKEEDFNKRFGSRQQFKTQCDDVLVQAVVCPPGDIRDQEEEVVCVVEKDQLQEFITCLKLSPTEKLRVECETKKNSHVRIRSHSLFSPSMMLYVYNKDKKQLSWKKCFGQGRGVVNIWIQDISAGFCQMLKKSIGQNKKSLHVVSIYLEKTADLQTLQAELDKQGGTGFLSFFTGGSDADTEEEQSGQNIRALRITAKDEETVEKSFKRACDYLVEMNTKLAEKDRDQSATKSSGEPIQEKTSGKLNPGAISKQVQEYGLTVKSGQNMPRVNQPSDTGKPRDLTAITFKAADNEIQNLKLRTPEWKVFKHPLNKDDTSYVTVCPEEGGIAAMKNIRENLRDQNPELAVKQMLFNTRVKITKEDAKKKKSLDKSVERFGISLKQEGNAHYMEGMYIQVAAAMEYLEQDDKTSETEDMPSQDTLPSSSSTLELEKVNYEAMKYFISNIQLEKICTTRQLSNGRIKVRFYGTKTAEEIRLRVNAFNTDQVEVSVSNREDCQGFLKNNMEEHKKVYLELSDNSKSVTIISEDWGEMDAAKKKIIRNFGAIKPRTRARRNFAGSAQQSSASESGTAASSNPPTSSSLTEGEMLSMQLHNKQQIDVGCLGVYVYKSNLTKLHLDAIVNAANENLCHASGLAHAIVVAAGRELDDEGKRYVQLNGPIPVTGVVATTAGNLPCQMVLHAVGPRWGDYTGHNQREICFRDLTRTVLRCLIEADRNGARDVAIPSISSGIFRVPHDVCCEAYVRGTRLFAENCSPRTLKRAHFVDISDRMLAMIQDTFTRSKGQPLHATDEETKFIRQYMDKGTVPRKRLAENSGSQDGTSSKEPDEAQKSVSCTYTIDGSQTTVKLYCGDLTKVEVHGVVSWENCRMQPVTKDAEELRKVTGEVKLQVGQMSKIGFLDVNTTHPGKLTTVKKIIHAAVPTDSLTCKDLKTLLERIVAMVSSLSLHSVAMTLLTCRKVREDESAEVFCKCLIAHVKESTSLKEVHVVDCQPGKVARIKKIFDYHFHLESTEYNGFEVLVEQKTEVERCNICLDDIENEKVLKCGHRFCKKCIDESFSHKPVCPTCGAIYGAVTGTMPPGIMTVTDSYWSSLPGCARGTYTIMYTIPDGIQKEEHPNRGERFFGANWTAYLPQTREGEKVLRLLKVAFARRLTFTVGRSTTTGVENKVTWNDIHHKTSTRYGDPFGYPDPGYLKRVTEELAAKGVKEANIDWSPPVTQTVRVTYK